MDRFTATVGCFSTGPFPCEVNVMMCDGGRGGTPWFPLLYLRSVHQIRVTVVPLGQVDRQWQNRQPAALPASGHMVSVWSYVSAPPAVSDSGITDCG